MVLLVYCMRSVLNYLIGLLLHRYSPVIEKSSISTCRELVVAQFDRASLSNQCRAELHSFEPRPTHYLLPEAVIYLLLYDSLRQLLRTDSLSCT